MGTQACEIKNLRIIYSVILLMVKNNKTIDTTTGEITIELLGHFDIETCF